MAAGGSAAPRSGHSSASVVAVVGLGLLLAAVAATLHAGVPNEARWRLLALIGLCWLAFAVAAAALLRTPPRVAVPLLFLGALALQALAISVPPQLTDDYFRYVWDGRVQAAGVDPYRYPPVDPALADLRTDWLFPPGCVAADGAACTRMNHPASPTIYPPVAQAWFWVLHQVTRALGPDGGGALALQVAAAVLALGTTAALVLVLRRVGDPRTAVLWAWCPTVVLEAGNNAHVDVLAALLVVLAMGWAVGRRPGWSGIATGAAIAVKLLPALVVPALVAHWLSRAAGRRRAVTWAAGMGLVLAVGYLPHVWAVGPRVLGFLPGYLDEEGFGGERRFALVRLLVPQAWAPVAAVGLLLLTTAVVVRLTWADPPWRGAVVLVAVSFAVVGVSYPWYALLLAALVALDGRGRWLAFAAAAYPGYFTAALGLRFADTQRAGYGAAVLVVLVAPAVARAVSRRRERAAVG